MAEKETKILSEADIIIASKISAGPFGSSVSSFPPSWLKNDHARFVVRNPEMKLAAKSISM
jgi:hypothetical protein